MSAICTCKNATVFTPENSTDRACRDCGCWWIPKYGSVEPDGYSAKVRYGQRHTAPEPEQRNPQGPHWTRFAKRKKCRVSRPRDKDR